MRRRLRFLVGLGLGVTGLAIYLSLIGAEQALGRVLSVTRVVLLTVLLLVVLEGVVDGLGVWASVRQLNGGVSPRSAVRLALAGDFFDILSPAGPVSSEPIVAVATRRLTETSYTEVLGARTVAVYSKATAQVFVSSVLGLLILTGQPRGGRLLSLFLVLSVGSILLVWLLARFWSSLRVGALAIGRTFGRAIPFEGGRRVWDHLPEEPLSRFEGRARALSRAPRLVVLIGIGGLLEQCLTATALYVALAGIGEPVSLAVLVVLVPFPQIAAVVPVPAGIGAHETLMAGAISVVAGVTIVPATAAVLIVRTLSIPFGLSVGGISAALLPGWSPFGGDAQPER